MSFRKRNVGLTGTTRSEGAPQTNLKERIQLPGVRPSPVDGRLTTSTGTASLDSLLAGHSGLPVGCSLLFEESGTTDYAGALLRFYAAEGLLQGHHVHVVGLPEHWGRELPGAVGDTEKKATPAETEKMKIAWRYESLGQFGAGTAGRGGHIHPCCRRAMTQWLYFLHNIPQFAGLPFRGLFRLTPLLPQNGPRLRRVDKSKVEQSRRVARPRPFAIPLT